MTAKVGYSWSWKRREAEVAMLADGVLRVERFCLGEFDEDSDGLYAALDGLRPPPGFELTLHDAADDPDYWNRDEGEARDALEVIARERGMAQCERSAPSMSNRLEPQVALLTAVLRRRGMGNMLGVVGTSTGVELLAVDPRRLFERQLSHAILHEQLGMAGGLEAEIAVLRTIVHSNPAPSAWLVVGSGCGQMVQSLASLEAAQSLVVPAHAGAARGVGLLLDDLRRSYSVDFNDLGGLRAGDSAALRTGFLRLMDQASSEATRLGFDTDDLICQKSVFVARPGGDSIFQISCDRLSTIEEILDYHAQLRRATGGGDLPNKAVIGASILAIIETTKPRLPAVAESSTIVGAGRPAQTVVDGPGVMRACLTEITVPAGWRATWEESGDVVLTREA